MGKIKHFFIVRYGAVSTIQLQCVSFSCESRFVLKSFKRWQPLTRVNCLTFSYRHRARAGLLSLLVRCKTRCDETSMCVVVAGNGAASTKTATNGTDSICSPCELPLRDLEAEDTERL
jgi:hypothetical protein